MFRGVSTPLEGFTDPDRLLALALVKYEADLCRGCGWPLTYSTHPNTQHHWEAPAPTRCHACTAKDAAADQYRDAQQPGALRHSVVPDDALWTAMLDPTMPPTSRPAVGVTGTVYPMDGPPLEPTTDN